MLVLCSHDLYSAQPSDQSTMQNLVNIQNTWIQPPIPAHLSSLPRLKNIEGQPKLEFHSAASSDALVIRSEKLADQFGVKVSSSLTLAGATGVIVLYASCGLWTG